MKNRLELARHFADLGFTRGAEIGVCDGYYSKVLCDNIPNLVLWGIDPYLSYPEYGDYRGQETLDRAFEGAKKLLAPYPKYTFVKTLSVEASKLVPDFSLDFVFIDGNHDYNFVRNDIRSWTPKVRPGGIVSGHDYYVFRSGNDGVVRAVDEYVKECGYQLHLTERDRRAYRDDKQPCWYFYK